MTEELAKMSTSIIPSSPADLKKISDAIDEMVNSKTRAKAESDLQTEIVNKLYDEFKISKAWIRDAAADRYANTFDARVQKQDEYEIFYEKVNAIKQNASAIASSQVVVDNV